MAAADPELALRLAKETADIYGDAVARLLRIVADRLARGITEPGWAERKLDDVVRLRAEILDEISRLDDAGADAAERAVVDAHRRGVRAAAGELRGPRIAGTLTGTQRTAVDALAREIVATPAADRIAEGVVEQLAGTHLRILRSTLDAYRQTVAEAALPGVAAGVDTRRVAAQRALDRFAQQGVTGFVDAAGRRWQLESYVEMATRTGSGRAMVQGRLDAYRAAGRDLVIVSDAPQECSACRPWEGKVLSLSGQTSGRLDRGFSVAGTVDQATSAGLFHANCRHDLRPYVAGLTERMTHTADREGDRARQQQRYLERGVRRWKRVEAVALDDAARARAQARSRAWQARIRGHVDEHGLKRQRQREQVGRAR